VLPIEKKLYLHQREEGRKNMMIELGTVAHDCNPSYSGGRDQEDRGSKPSEANCSGDHISKKPFTKKG
jgi:hypothetical protein